MKYSNITSLREFYSLDVGEKMSDQISEYLKSKRGQVLIIGYGKPFLSKIKNEKLIYAIPFGYEINRWPEIRPFRTIVVEEKKLPFATDSFDTIVVLNFLEFCKNIRVFLNEISRISKKNGNLVIISFNKRDFWKKVKHVRYSINELLMHLESKDFCLQQVYCINEKLDLFHSLKAFKLLLLRTTPIFYDIVILDMIKNTESAESVVNFQEKFGIS